MATYAIEKSIPVPAKRPGRPRVYEYPFAGMEVGDSFSAPRDMGQTKNGQDKRQNTIGSCARGYTKRRNPTAKFTVRVVDENTVRCWRVA